jgi:hypothetical protein
MNIYKNNKAWKRMRYFIFIGIYIELEYQYEGHPTLLYFYDDWKLIKSCLERVHAI